MGENFALLFTDIVDSTLTTQRLGDELARALWVEHDRRARDLLRRHHGREIDRADGFLLLFDSAIDAAQHALDYQAALADLGLAARAGLHVGPVVLRRASAEDMALGAKPIEVEGLAKPLAARVMAMARGGQTLLSSAARHALEEAGLDAAMQVCSHGHYRLKGIDEPVEVFELGAVPHCSFTPPADADKSYRVVRSGDLWQPARDIPRHLPTERDAFVGRGADLQAIARQFDAGARLLTLLGPGGTGKTRLAIRYGHAWLGDWPGGVYFCDLSEARTLDAIYFAMAGALEVALGRDDPGVQLGNAIAGRGRCLVILDNFEQITQHAAATVAYWLDCTREAAFIVTSRERMHLVGEASFAVEPLAVGGDAIELFVARARVHRPDFTLTDANRGFVAEVVRLLDGLPLAIELAAARVRLMSPAQLVERMRDRFAILAGARGAAARQATLRAAIDWSWELLTPWEQDAFAQCSVFDGGFTLEAAEAVLELSGWPQAPPPMDVVQALFDKSLLRTWVPTSQTRYDLDEPYFGMYLSIREYAAGKLDDAGEAARVMTESRHGSYFARFGSTEEAERLFVHGGVRRRRALTLELDNLVAACRRAAGRGDGAVAAATLRVACDIIELIGPYSLVVSLGATVLAMQGLDSPSRARALVARAMGLRRAGRGDDSGAAFEEALTLYRALGNRDREAFALLALGNLRRDQGRIDEARVLQERALAITREVGYRRVEGHALGNLGIIHAEQGRLREARTHFEQALAVHREIGNRYIEGIDSSNLGNVCRDCGNFEEAKAHYEHALAIDREVGNRRDEGIVMANLGLLCRDLAQYEEARAHLVAALVGAREVGDRRFEGSVLGYLAMLLRDQGSDDDAIAHAEQALALHRAVGNRHQEGVMLGTLGELLARRGRFDEARSALAMGDVLLRDLGAAPAHVSLLCDWARAEAAAGDPVASQQKLTDAAHMLDAAGLGLDSEVGRQLTELRQRLIGRGVR